MNNKYFREGIEYEYSHKNNEIYILIPVFKYLLM